MSFPFFQQTMTVLATGGATGGALGAVEVVCPGGAAPPMHVHHREDEAFYVVEGVYSLFVGDEVIPGAPGTWVWGPRDVPHGYQVHSPLGRHLSLIMPAGFEAFFEEVADLATPTADPGATMGQLAAVAARYDVELLGPPPARS